MTTSRIEKVAIVGTGDMGSAVGASLKADGIEVLTCLSGRSERSRMLAINAGFMATDTLNDLVADADILLSVIPPAGASDFARQVCAAIQSTGNDTLFVDCNAVAPMTATAIADLAASNNVRFQDVGIVGAAPREGRMPVRFYTSGPFTDEILQLSTDLIAVKPMGPEIGRASALKMTYASLTKGTHALRAAAILLGEQLGVGEEIRAEWQHSLPDVYKAMQSRIPVLAPDSGRWTGEMREIAATCASAGLPPSFHQGAEWIYEFLAQTTLAEESRDEASEKNRSLEETIRLLHDAHSLYI